MMIYDNFEDFLTTQNDDDDDDDDDDGDDDDDDCDDDDDDGNDDFNVFFTFVIRGYVKTTTAYKTAVCESLEVLFW